MTKPDFICIGPEKTATTWLYSMLEDHPAVWLPPYKELRFLTEGNLVPAHSLRHLFFSPHWHCRELRRILFRNSVKFLLMRKTGGFGPWQAYRWVLHYMFGRHDFDWYASLFRGGESRLCGDITPNYYHIPESRIAELYRHNPATRILVFVRNPIERAWSEAVMDLCVHEGRDFDAVSEAEWIAMLDAIGDLWRPYQEVIARWRRWFPDMYVGWFDQLREEPDTFLAGVARYLDIDPDLCAKPAGKVVGKGVGRAMPDAIREHLIQRYGDEIRQLADAGLSAYPARWLRDMTSEPSSR